MEQTQYPLTVQLSRGLSDRMPEKRRAAALDLEKMVKQWDPTESSDLKKLLHVLNQDFCNSANPNSRKGGLLGIAVTAVALGRRSVSVYLPELIPPACICCRDPDPKVRYQSCETLFNIIKVARSSSLIFFKEVFSNVAQLYTDSDGNVRTCAETLNRLLMDVVRESPHFDIEVFIGLLQSHQHAIKPQVRQFIISWVHLLQRLTSVTLLDHLPEFLNGLFEILGDGNPEIVKMTEGVLGEFLAGLQRSSVSPSRYHDMTNIVISHSHSENFVIKKIALEWLMVFVEQAGRGLLPLLSNIITAVLPCLDSSDDNIKTVAVTLNSKLKSLISSEDDKETDPPVRVMIERTISEEQAPRNESETGPMDPVRKEALALGEDVAAFHKQDENDEDPLDTPPGSEEEDNNEQVEQDDKKPTSAPIENDWIEVTTDGPMHSHKASQVPKVIHLQVTSQEHSQLKLSAVLEVILNHVSFTVMEIRIEALGWLIWLQQEIPKRLSHFSMVINKSLTSSLHDSHDEAIPLILKIIAMMSDSEVGLNNDKVRAKDLPFQELLQRYEGSTILKDFITKLLGHFRKDKGILVTRGSFIIRHFCLLIQPEIVYSLIAKVLPNERDLPFIATMVQSLNLILLTSAELFEMRCHLKDLPSDDYWSLYKLLYICWCHNPVSTITLCLLTQNYKQASDLIDNFCDINVTASILGELDRLVQLLESPIFTYLRLQILDPLEHPFLIRSLFGVLMLLPQSSTFTILHQRLSCIPALSILNTAPSKSEEHANPPKKVEIDFNGMIKHFIEIQKLHSR